MKNLLETDSEKVTLSKQENFKERHKGDYYMKNKLYRLWDTLKPAVILGLSVFCLFKLVLLNGFIPSESMEPTLNVSNFVIANRLAYSFDSPKRGDVVVIDSEEYGQLLVKRVIGLPGDIIELKDNKVYINGCLLDESDYAHGITAVLKEGNNYFVVPENCVFVMGDNREDSADARFWESPYINYKDLVGKVFLEYSIGGDDGFFIKRIQSIEPKFTN